MRNDDNAVGIYLREIGGGERLTVEEERKLAGRIKKGDRKARFRMIEANLKLVVKIANDYANYGLPLPDLISEGNIGLMKGVERFNPRKGGKLSTYAAWWIKQSIRRALANQSRTIRLPVHFLEKISRMRKTELRLMEKFGRQPDREELARALKIPPETVDRWREAAVRPASLDAPLGDDAESTLKDVIEDPGVLNPSDQFQNENFRREIKDLLDELDPRESEIVRQRFGLNGEDVRTLEDLGRRFHITRERVRQIQVSALHKMRRLMKK